MEKNKTFSTFLMLMLYENIKSLYRFDKCNAFNLKLDQVPFLKVALTVILYIYDIYSRTNKDQS